MNASTSNYAANISFFISDSVFSSVWLSHTVYQAECLFFNRLMYSDWGRLHLHTCIKRSSCKTTLDSPLLWQCISSLSHYSMMVSLAGFITVMQSYWLALWFYTVLFVLLINCLPMIKHIVVHYLVDGLELVGYMYQMFQISN